MNSQKLVIYHGGCRDGFAAAWAAHLVMPDAIFFPGYYGQDPPDLVDGRDVYILDFTYPRETLKKVVAIAASLTILDHHKTNLKDLEGFADEVATLGAPRPRVVFDMERSGAGITWDELCGNDKPWLINYIEDRDLWRWALPESRLVNAYLGAIPFTFEAFDDASRRSFGDAVLAGAVVQLKVKQYCEEVGKNAITFDLPVYSGSNLRIYRDVPLVNAPQCDISELLEHLMDRGKVEFVMGWWQRQDGMFQYSLRSRGDFDVSAIAKHFGGGGHKNAAGFQVHHVIHYNVELGVTAVLD